jgi:pimeloyl-ACP methyl ester carboxylesterase
VLPHLKSRIRAVVGGSLGGNMSLRLGQTALPWIRNVIPWSPAAIWTSYAGGANPGNHLGVAMPVMWAGADARQREETPARRREFFYKAFDWTAGILKRKPQSEEWYRDKWTCKRTHLAGARLDRHETYDQNFRLWHWRLGAEQIIFSHQSPPRYLQNRKRTLLLCGYEDTGGDLCLHTRNVAPKMVNTPGKALFLRDTGHSIHNERPCWLAQHIVEFLGAPIGSCR